MDEVRSPVKLTQLLRRTTSVLVAGVSSPALLLSLSTAGKAQVIVAPDSTPIAPQQATSGLCPAQLADAINPIAARSPAIRWGIFVQTLADSAARKTLYARNPDALMIPASNNKLFTTAAALQKLGAQFRIRTTVTGSSSGANLAMLRIMGRGDPSLNTARLNRLTQQLSQNGIQQVSLLVGDDTYFRGAAVNPNWDADDTLAGYGAPVNSLMLNQNAIALTLFPQRVGQPLRVQWDDPTDASDWPLDNQSVTVATNQEEFLEVYRDRTARIIHVEGQLRAGAASEPAAASIPNPGNYLVGKFRNALTAARIAVRQSTLVKSTPASPGDVELVALDSPPLSELLKETNQESNNIYAEALLKTVGKAQNPASLGDATANGVAAVKAILTPLGVNPNRYSMVDGSGLATRNRASAEALVQTLQAMAIAPESQVYRASLPVAGVSGTLKDRFRNTPAQGRLHAKTGTLSVAISLSGYLTPANHPPVVFSILTNYSNVSISTVRTAVDEIALVLTRLKRC
ncbi:MAG: D-alanyl-D-alanine carboxypeptidase/D-alanyl-D-alanine-endopeptidase [Leptolyngbyaceae cyanobacterium RU_5_1]|nr:D-alanyl-D-alanine carboxypeptidase/D-alanyl-D-alanine-endopeptidase [Leptolyngbyaceae cyanobacterium RU_5_1]